MSFAADDNLGYFDTIQMFFVEATHRSIFFSGRDLELLERWRDQGATARVVCRGIREAVEALPDDDPPRDVHACRKWIEPRVERARRRSAGRNDGSDAEEGDAAEDAEAGGSRGDASTGAESAGEQPTGLVATALARIEAAGRDCDDEQIRQLYREAWRRVRKLQAVDEPGRRFEELAAVEEALVEGYYRTLGREHQRRVEAQLDEEAGEFLERMSGEARREHKLARCRRILIDEFGFVPVLE